MDAHFYSEIDKSAVFELLTVLIGLDIALKFFIYSFYHIGWWSNWGACSVFIVCLDACLLCIMRMLNNARQQSRSGYNGCYLRYCEGRVIGQSSSMAD